VTEHLPGEHLRHAYESIRAQATGLVGPETRPARGLALLLRSGLAGWMQAWRSLVATPAVEALPHRTEILTPLALSGELAIILAQMALGGPAANLIRESAG